LLHWPARQRAGGIKADLAIRNTLGGHRQNLSMAKKLIAIRATYDRKAKVWWIKSSDLFGLHAEGATLEELRDKLPGMVSDLIEANEPSWLNHDIVVEIIARARLRIRAPAVATA
jgi:predicted RNase H-like HicB family nuclease